jgi:hypothetical protein
MTHVARGVLQLALAYIGSLLLVMMASVLLRVPDGPAWLAVNYVIFLVTGVAFALLISRLMPAAAREGRLIWIPPVALLVGCIWWDLSLGHSDAIQVAVAGTGEAGWLNALVTLPAWSCCWYSATMARQLGLVSNRP